MSLRTALLVLVALLGYRLQASEEESLPWSEARIVGVEREDTGKVVFVARTTGDEYREVILEAFGKQFVLAKDDLPKLKGFPLNSLTITHEAGFVQLGGHMVHFKLKMVYYDKAARLIEEKVTLSVSRGKGLSISERTQRVVK
jgi:hypothetical protein